MPSPAKVLASISPRREFNPQVSGRLTDALRKHQSDADLEGLRRAYNRHLARQEALKKTPSLAQAIRRGFFSFNIAPSNAYDRYMAVVKNRNDADAIRANWETVGEHLSYALIKRILEEEKANERKKETNGHVATGRKTHTKIFTGNSQRYIDRRACRQNA